MRRIALALLTVAAACKGKEAPKPVPATVATVAAVDAPGADAGVDPGSCDAALAAAAKAPANRRAQMILGGCHPCGDWAPLLAWNTEQADGGPTRASIEKAMLACDAYCDPNAKARFLGALDTARGQATRLPWRLLGEFCKDRVSAGPDARFMTAPYFALDRIARDAAARPTTAALLHAIELPLPAVGVTGTGLELPTSAVTKPDAGPTEITVTMTEIRVGTLPRGTLSSTGVAVTGDYPGTLVAAKDLAAALDKLADPVAVFAPRGMPAARLVAVVAAAGKHPLMLAVAAESGLAGWALYGVVPIALGATPEPRAVTFAVDASTDAVTKAIAIAPAASFATPPTVAISPKGTVDGLARVLGVLGYKDVRAVALTATRP